MGRLTPEDKATIAARKEKASGGFGRSRGIPIRGRAAGGRALGMLERADRLLGLGLGSIGSLATSPQALGTALTGTALPIPMPQEDQAPKTMQVPDPVNIPSAAMAFWEQARQGDVDTGITAFQDAMKAGPGYWGTAEIGGALVGPTGALKGLGMGVRRLGQVPRLADTLPRASGVLRETGRVLEAPWAAEEAAGKAVLGGLGRLGLGAARKVGLFPEKPAVAAKGISEQVEDVVQFPPRDEPRRPIGEKRTRYEQGIDEGGIPEGTLGTYAVEPQSRGGSFYQGILRTRATHRYGAAVEVKDPAFYSDPTTRLYLTPDDSAGVAVTPDGDLVSVYRKTDSPYDINPLLDEASKVSITLDAYDIGGKLPNLYADHGFRPAARVRFNPEFAPEGWNYELMGEPDIVFMVRDVDGLTGLPEIPLTRVREDGVRVGGYKDIMDDIPLFDDYDEAVKVRDAALQKVQQGTDARASVTPGAEDIPETAGWGPPERRPIGVSPYEGTQIKEVDLPIRGGRTEPFDIDTPQGIGQEIRNRKKLIQDEKKARLRALTGGAKRRVIATYDSAIAAHEKEIERLTQVLDEEFPESPATKLPSGHFEKKIMEEEWNKALQEKGITEEQYVSQSGLVDPKRLDPNWRDLDLDQPQWMPGRRERLVRSTVEPWMDPYGDIPTGPDLFDIGKTARERAITRIRNIVEPPVVRDIPISASAPDDEAVSIVTSADPSPPKRIFDSTPEEVFDDLKNLASPDELVKIGKNPLNVIQTIMRRHEGAINALQSEATRIVKGGLGEADKGEGQLRELGLSIGRGGREVIREDALPEIDALYKALHGEAPVPERLRGLYDELKDLADFEEASRIDFDPEFATVQDYFYRGWKRSDALIAEQGKAQIGGTPKFKKPRKDASYQEMRDAGFEPLSWNPFEQWRISRMQGVRYRQQMTLVWQLKKVGLWRPSGGATAEGVEGIIGLDGSTWRTPNIGRAFEGRPVSISDDLVDEVGQSTGEKMMAEIRVGRGVVPSDVARRLEAMYGKMPEGFGELEFLGKQINLAKAIDTVVFIPKRAKLFASFFQQIDFLSRNLYGTFSHMVDRVLAGDLVGAAQAGKKWPTSALNILRANLSPGYRQELKRMLGSTEALVPGRPGIHLKGIMEAGLSIRDVTIFPTELGDIARMAADDAGLLGSKAVLRYIAQLESAMKNGLFDGVYPAAQITDIKNNVAQQMVRTFGHMTDEQINGAIARFINMRYSTIPVSQSVIQNRWLRGLLQRVFFSIGESEGLLRASASAFTGPYAGMWRKHWLGAYIAVIGVANAIHLASTGAQGEPKALPWERWSPISTNNWGLLPISYNRDFASPNLPWKGRGAAELTMDIVGQMDTAFRLLDPASFLSARESVPVRALTNQIKGEDWYGADITAAGPMGIYSRTASLLNDMFAPIGVGAAVVGIAQEQIPAVAAVLPPGEQRLGFWGQIAQGTGVNIRGEQTGRYRDRITKESGYIIQAPHERAGQPAEQWADLTPKQQQDLRKERPEFSEEEQKRTEIGALRGQEYAITQVEQQKYEQELFSKVQKAVDRHLSAPVGDPRWVPSDAKKKIYDLLSEHYTSLYGDLDDPETGELTGGLYTIDRESPVPDEGTLAYLRWQYRELLEGAKDLTGEVDFEKFNEDVGKFWANLKPAEVITLLENQRLLENELDPAAQTVLDASRYVSNVKISLNGGPRLSYWNLDKHPKVTNYLMRTTGATHAEIIDYLDMTKNERAATERTSTGKAIGKALARANREGGELWMLKDAFVREVPDAWVWGMMDAGNRYKGSDTIEAFLFKQLGEGRQKPAVDYRNKLQEVLTAR